MLVAFREQRLTAGLLKCVLRKYSASAQKGLAASTNTFKLRKALIVAKLSRFEFEKARFPELNAVQLEQRIRDRGTDYDSLVTYNDQHVRFRNEVVDSFKECGVEVRMVDR